MLGTFKADVQIVDDTTISVDGKPIKVVSSRDPLKLPWAEMGIDIVIEVHRHTSARSCCPSCVMLWLPTCMATGAKLTNCMCRTYVKGTGVFVDGPGAGKHIQAGAKKVIITAPAKGADIPTYVVGVNEGDYDHSVADIIRCVLIPALFFLLCDSGDPESIILSS
jgi:glyceraldehyde-3-phosphate dehydrogenase (NADP+) (phosphorylating)